MRTATVEASTMKSPTETRLSTRGHSSHVAAMIKTAESARVHAGLMTYPGGSMSCWYPSPAGMKTLTSVIEPGRAAAEIRLAIIETTSATIDCVMIEKSSAV